ncbi:MAG: hypothetical protein ACR2MY_04890 [Candidatus Dormibacteria bacterium]
MAYVVARPRGRWEIRESYVTPKGPRSRTLAAFRSLTNDVVARAVAASAGPLDPHRLRAQCLAAGVPVGETVADSAARALLAEIAAQRLPSRPLQRRLAGALSGPRMAVPASHPEGVRDWRGATLGQRGETLLDLLDLADHLPARPVTPLRFPRMRANHLGR